MATISTIESDAALFEIASRIAPRKMSDILGPMAPEAGQRLTVEAARRAGQPVTLRENR